MDFEDQNRYFFRWILGVACFALLLLGIIFLWPRTKSGNSSFFSDFLHLFTGRISQEQSAPVSPWTGEHVKISTTFFWIGEGESKDNKNISNVRSAWDDEWALHYGGVDTPKERSGFHPAGFTPKENPFYFALPYNDFDKKGKRKSEAFKIVPWAHDQAWLTTESMLKNQWIRISKNELTAYAQWEDVGPFGENDAEYVFGKAAPKSRTNQHAGLDLSPAVHDYLKLGDVDEVDWQFVKASEVPSGPWKELVTTSQVNWK